MGYMSPRYHERVSNGCRRIGEERHPVGLFPHNAGCGVLARDDSAKGALLRQGIGHGDMVT